MGVRFPLGGPNISLCGEIGRHRRLKICRFKRRTGSIPVGGTKNKSHFLMVFKMKNE